MIGHDNPNDQPLTSVVAVRVEVDIKIEGHGFDTLIFEVPPNHEVVKALLAIKDQQVLERVRAAGPGQMGWF
jgi:hypothetical protein